MSPIAELLVNLGYTVTGSDRQHSEASARLETIGIIIQYDHEPVLVKECAIVVYSSAVKDGSPERVYAREHGIPQIRRAELLGDLMRMQTTICISGTHGKTTTTSLSGTILCKAGLDPTVLVGGMLRDIGAHAMIGHGNLMVAEADEFDRSFLAMFPMVAVITNIDADHLDCYRDLADIKMAFIEFISKVPFYGCVIACTDDEGVRDILPSIQARVVTYGVDHAAVISAKDIRFENGCGAFTVLEHGKEIGCVKLTIPGMHNVRNALAAIAVGLLFDIPMQTMAEALASFGGVKRRFEQRAEIDGIRIIDDYAHHPREIEATLEAARNATKGRVLAIFQPHLYTRTRDFMDDFALVLAKADRVWVTPIYKSREEPIPGVHAEAIIEKMAGAGHRNAFFAADLMSLTKEIVAEAKQDDIVVFMGAGNINETADALIGVYHGQT